MSRRFIFALTSTSLLLGWCPSGALARGLLPLPSEPPPVASTTGGEEETPDETQRRTTVTAADVDAGPPTVGSAAVPQQAVSQEQDEAQEEEAEEKSGPRFSFGGQYRINAYTVDNDVGDRQTAARARIRQNIDIEFDERFKTHLQLELGHTASNLTTTDTKIAVRHAVIDYTFSGGVNFQAGIVPLGDHFGDSQFSSDWDYNPVALSVNAPLGPGTLRAFGGNLREALETDVSDDFVHYQVDYELPLVGDNRLDFSATLATIPGLDGDKYVHANYGLGGSYRLTDDLLLRGFLLGSHTDGQLLANRGDAAGIAAKLELSSASGLAVMVTYASGDADGNGFLPIMALAATNGYWGYTGILTVQGPTDTGFDGDSVNFSNNGFGMSTVQVKYARSLNQQFDIYLAGGWFGATNVPSDRSSLIGGDFLAMVTYHFNTILAMDFGTAYAPLQDSVSGYSNGVIGGASFNQPAGVERDKYAFFLRLQAEF